MKRVEITPEAFICGQVVPRTANKRQCLLHLVDRNESKDVQLDLLGQIRKVDLFATFLVTGIPSSFVLAAFSFLLAGHVA